MTDRPKPKKILDFLSDSSIHPSVRAKTAEALVSVSDHLREKDYASLRKMIGDAGIPAEVRAPLIRSLAQIQPPHPDLAGWLTETGEREPSTSTQVHAALAAALAILGSMPPEAQKRLIGIVRNRNLPLDSRRAALADLELGGERTPEWLDAAWLLAKSEEEHHLLREDGMRVMMNHGGWRLGADTLIERILMAPDYPYTLRELAAGWAASIPEHAPNLIELILQRADDGLEDTYFRLMCVSLILGRSHTGCQPWLSPALEVAFRLLRESQDSLFAREGLLRMLHGFEPVRERLMNQIEEDLRDPEIEIGYRDALLRLISQVPYDATPGILDVIVTITQDSDADMQLRRSALAAATQAAEIPQALKEYALSVLLANEDDGGLRVDACRLIQRHGMANREGMLQVLGRLQSRNMDVEVAVAMAEAMVAASPRHPFVEKVLFRMVLDGSMDVAVRQVLVMGLPERLILSELDLIERVLASDSEHPALQGALCQMLRRLNLEKRPEGLQNTLIRLIRRYDPADLSTSEALLTLSQLYPNEQTTRSILQDVMQDMHRNRLTRRHAAEILDKLGPGATR